MQPSLLSIDDVLDIAFDIFEEMAEDNLEFTDLENYQQQFDESGAAITLIPENDWENQLGFAIDRDLFIEVKIGFAPNDTLENVLVRMLINRDSTKKDCHLIWKRQQ